MKKGAEDPSVDEPEIGSSPVPGRVERAAATVVDSAIEVHRELGPGFTESVYQSCLVQELERRDVPVRSEVSVPVVYKGEAGHGALRLDLLVDSCLVVELKSVERLQRVHRKQLLGYLKLTGHRLGLLLNFEVPLMKDGIRRVIR